MICVLNFSLDTSLPNVGPGDSALTAKVSAAEPSLDVPLSFGSTATANASIPSPPIQWEKERQNRILSGNTSTVVRTVAPVVVYPETESKKASVKLGTAPLITDGNAPNTDISTHARAATAIPSFAESAPALLRFTNTNPPPTTPTAAADMRNARTHLSL